MKYILLTITGFILFMVTRPYSSGTGGEWLLLGLPVYYKTFSWLGWGYIAMAKELLKEVDSDEDKNSSGTMQEKQGDPDFRENIG